MKQQNTLRKIDMYNMKLKFNLFRKAVLAVLSVSLFVSCQDTWNNHYSTDTSVTVDMTIAEFLDQDPTLSNFVKVLKTTPVFTGKKATEQSYYEFLKEKQFVTMWVPSNESLSKEEWDVYMKENKSTDTAYHVQLEFIKYHMALANPTAAIDGKKKVTMMSKKYFMVGPDNIDGVEYIPGACNIACNNGVIHKLKDQALKYKKSLYEILTTEPQFSLIGMFLDSYYETELDESQSVSAGVDEYGDIVAHQNLSTNIKNINVTASVLATKAVDLVYSYSGVPSDGYVVTGDLECDKKAVYIAGKPSVIDNISAANINAYVDLTGLGVGEHDVAIKIDNTNPLVHYVYDGTVKVKISNE